MAIAQDAFIARHAARYWLCVCGTSALDFARHCAAAVISNQPKRAVVRFEETLLSEGSYARTKPVSPLFESPRRLTSTSTQPRRQLERLWARGLLGNVVLKRARAVGVCDLSSQHVSKAFLEALELLTGPFKSLSVNRLKYKYIKNHQFTVFREKWGHLSIKYNIYVTTLATEDTAGVQSLEATGFVTVLKSILEDSGPQPNYLFLVQLLLSLCICIQISVPCFLLVTCLLLLCLKKDTSWASKYIFITDSCWKELFELCCCVVQDDSGSYYKARLL